jgi:F0F1-type ATP synthase membrane subunit a
LEDYFYPFNTTAGLAVLTSLAYFYAGINKKGFELYFTYLNFLNIIFYKAIIN